MSETKVTQIRNGIVAAACGFSAGMLMDRASLLVVLTHAEGLRYTHAQVEMVYMSGILGLGIGLPVATLQRHLMTYYINLIACLGSILGFMLLWTATLYEGLFWDKAGILAIYNFIAGHSIGYAYYTSLWVGMGSFPSSKNVFSWLHHLPMVCSALLLWIVVSNMLRLLLVQLVVVTVSSFLAIALLRTPSRVEEPVRVTGEARRFTLPALEYSASETESIAESDDSGVGEEHAHMIRGSMERHLRIWDALWESKAICISFALATSSCFCLAYEPVVSAEMRLVLSGIGATVGLAACHLPARSRVNFLLIVLAIRAVFLAIGIFDRGDPDVAVLLHCSGGFVVGVFFTVTPVMLFEVRGRKRLTILWSCAILCFVLFTALQTAVMLTLFDTQSPTAVCKDDRCPLLLTMTRLGITAISLISTMWLRDQQKAESDNDVDDVSAQQVVNGV